MYYILILYFVHPVQTRSSVNFKKRKWMLVTHCRRNLAKKPVVMSWKDSRCWHQDKQIDSITKEEKIKKKTKLKGRLTWEWKKTQSMRKIVYKKTAKWQNRQLTEWCPKIFLINSIDKKHQVMKMTETQNVNIKTINS